MPVNMDPAKKRRKQQEQPPEPEPTSSERDKSMPTHAPQFGKETEDDRVKDLADAELKNLWDATEVIDMDRF
jgi:hypothetical protein